MPSRTSSFPSTPSMVSVTTTASASSTTPLRHAPPPSSSSSSSPSSQKDYSAAFGALQTQYGWGAVTSVPVESTKVAEAQERKRVVKEKKEQEKAKARRREMEMEAMSKSKSSAPQRDYESAFGALSSKMGFGGGWPPSAGQRRQ
ncbi:hypothetical protein C8T65DRAFT_738412 [Cerioporus squamosus]|nr:hypothetical protein C8T65DRAFT_738412 [Cerioporus squamosus]